MPQRIQLSRAKGWRKPAGVIVVSRPSRHGNPFRLINEEGYPLIESAGGLCWNGNVDLSWPDAERRVVELFRQWREQPERFPQLPAPPPIDELRGKNLACWCRLDRPCHADVLLELANRVLQ